MQGWEYSFRYLCAKNYQHRTWFDRVIKKIKRVQFFASQGRRMYGPSIRYVCIKLAKTDLPTPSTFICIGTSSSTLGYGLHNCIQNRILSFSPPLSQPSPFPSPSPSLPLSILTAIFAGGPVPECLHS